MFSRALPRAEQFADLLTREATVRGLIGPREVPRLWERHLLNCAVVTDLVPQDSSVCDIGSGAGLPGIVLALVAAALFGANIWVIVIILSVTMWPAVARIVRAEALRISQLGYVESARAAGFHSTRILWSDVIPNAMPPVIVATTMTVGRAILIESALAFLGIGDAEQPSWGALLNSAQSYMATGWWLALFPGLCIFLVVLAINMLGDSLNDSLNPSIGKVK